MKITKLVYLKNKSSDIIMVKTIRRKMWDVPTTPLINSVFIDLTSFVLESWDQSIYDEWEELEEDFKQEGEKILQSIWKVNGSLRDEIAEVEEELLQQKKNIEEGIYKHNKYVNIPFNKSIVLDEIRTLLSMIGYNQNYIWLSGRTCRRYLHLDNCKGEYFYKISLVGIPGEILDTRKVGSFDPTTAVIIKDGLELFPSQKKLIKEEIELIGVPIMSIEEMEILSERLRCYDRIIIATPITGLIKIMVNKGIKFDVLYNSNTSNTEEGWGII